MTTEFIIIKPDRSDQLKMSSFSKIRGLTIPPIFFFMASTPTVYPMNHPITSICAHFTEVKMTQRKYEVYENLFETLH